MNNQHNCDHTYGGHFKTSSRATTLKRPYSLTTEASLRIKRPLLATNLIGDPDPNTNTTPTSQLKPEMTPSVSNQSSVQSTRTRTTIRPARTSTSTSTTPSTVYAPPSSLASPIWARGTVIRPVARTAPSGSTTSANRNTNVPVRRADAETDVSTFRPLATAFVTPRSTNAASTPSGFRNLPRPARPPRIQGTGESQFGHWHPSPPPPSSRRISDDTSTSGNPTHPTTEASTRSNTLPVRTILASPQSRSNTTSSTMNSAATNPPNSPGTQANPIVVASPTVTPRPNARGRTSFTPRTSTHTTPTPASRLSDTGARVLGLPARQPFTPPTQTESPSPRQEPPRPRSDNRPAQTSRAQPSSAKTEHKPTHGTFRLPPTPGRKRAVEPDGECCICLDAPSDCVLYRCGHVCACLHCARKLKQCPICRVSVEDVIKMWKC
jgi:hypothetical protein